MRVMVILKATRNSEAAVPASEELLAAVGKFNDELLKAGVVLAGEGLHPSSKGKRVRIAGSGRSVVAGPFRETSELVAGYWIWNVGSMEEAVAWACRAPNMMPGEDAELEIRPIVEAEDFGDGFTPELRAQEARQRAALDHNNGA